MSGFSMLSSFAVLKSPRRWLSIAIPVIAWKMCLDEEKWKSFQQHIHIFCCKKNMQRTLAIAKNYSEFPAKYFERGMLAS